MSDESFAAREPSTITTPAPDEEGARWDRRIRAFTLVVLTTVVLSAAGGLLGVRTATAGATDNGYAIDVTYARVTRPGLATPFAIEVSSLDGAELPRRVTIAVSSTYLMMFDDNGIEPTPAESFNTTTTTWWIFDIPEGETALVVELDARLEPAVQWGETATAELWLDDREVVATEFTTWVMP